MSQPVELFARRKNMRRFLLLLTVMFCLASVSAWAADTGLLYAMNDSNNSLYSIDPNTYAVTLIGSTGIGSGDFGDLAYNPNTNTAYWAPGRDNNNLYTINLQNCSQGGKICGGFFCFSP